MAILTISRQYGSGGTEIGRTVADRMGYGYVDRERILEGLRKVGPKWEEWAQELDERRPTVWERNDWSFQGFTALVQKEILEYAAAGNVVIMGRGSNFLLKDIRSAYRVRIVAPFDARIDRIVARDRVDRGKARLILEESDTERSCFIQAMYDRRQDDRACYDAVIEVKGLEVGGIVQEIQDVLAERERFATDEERRTLCVRAAAARVKAGIAANPRFFVPTLNVDVEEDTLIVRGVAHSAGEYRRIEEEAARLAGSVSIRYDLHFRG